MSDITDGPPPHAGGNMFTGKLGPLPVWGWSVLVAAVVLYFVYGRKKTTGSNLVTGPSVTGASPANVSNVPIQDVATTNTGTSGVADTNTSWLQQGIKQGTDLGYTPLDTETALRNYLDGTPLTQSQANVVNSIEKAQGSAPQGIGGTPSVIPPETPTTPAPAVPTPAPQSTPAPPTQTDPRRQAIVMDYQTFLGRTPTVGEINWWDSQTLDTTQIRSGILNSPEAKINEPGK